MGCDIHLTAEVRSSDGAWQEIGALIPYEDDPVHLR